MPCDERSQTGSHGHSSQRWIEPGAAATAKGETGVQLNGVAFFLMAFAAGAFAQTAVTTTTGGSAGSVPVFTGASNVENSVITQQNGNVGIGTTSPQAPLDIRSGGLISAGVMDLNGSSVNSGNTSLILNNGSTGGESYTLTAGIPSITEGGFSINKLTNYSFGAWMQTYLSTTVLAIRGGNVGIGTTSPQYALDVAGQIRSSSGGVVFPDGTTQTTAFIPANCGADFAEAVDVTGKRIGYQPGDVLVIDPDHAGKFLEANQAYSTMVAGIYSTKPGFVGRLYPASDQRSAGEVPMAMVGRVPTKVTAENGPIHVGDLLVSSSTPGFAMRGTDRGRMLGAVIGKALGSLNSGKGMIEVLVTLQ